MEQMYSVYKRDIFVSLEEKTAPFHVMSFDRHGVYEIYLLLSGERRVFVEERVYETETGDALLLKPDVRHRSEGSVPYRGICIQFSEEQLDKYFTPFMKSWLVGAFARQVISLSREAMQEAQFVCCRMIAHPERKALCLPMLLQLLLTAAEAAGAEKQGEEGAVTAKGITAYLQENAQEIQGLEQVAEHFGITREYLCSMFKRRTGMTVMHYLNNVRIEKACRLLSATRLPVEQVAEQCGFSSTIYFHRVFKKVMNDTPARWRRLMKESHRSEIITEE